MQKINILHHPKEWTKLVKVAAKLHWNSRDDKIVGHSMTSEEMSTLSDLYKVFLTDMHSKK